MGRQVTPPHARALASRPQARQHTAMGAYTRTNPYGLIQLTVLGDSNHRSLKNAPRLRSSSNFLCAPFFWPESIRVDFGFASRALDYGRLGEPMCLKIGRGDWIRTSDLPVPNRTLYQAEPRPDISTHLPFQPQCTRFLGPEPRNNRLIAQ